MSTKSILDMRYRQYREEPTEDRDCGDCGHCIPRGGRWICEIADRADCREEGGNAYYHSWVPRKGLNWSIRMDADGNGMVCIQDSFGISGVMVRAEDLIGYLEGLGK